MRADISTSPSGTCLRQPRLAAYGWDSSSITCGSGRFCRSMSRRCRVYCIRGRDMATNHDDYDLLKNPAVDYDRTDRSPRGILFFLVGLLIAGVFIEIVLWGMFHFLARSPFFAKGNPSPMLNVQKEAPLTAAGKDFENTSNVNPVTSHEPRLQVNEVLDIDQLLASEQKVLDTEESFAEQIGTIH